jgi:hypothetical protein
MAFDELALINLVLIARLLGFWDLGRDERNGFEQNVLRLDITGPMLEKFQIAQHLSST